MKNSIKKMSAMLVLSTAILGTVSTTAYAKTSTSNTNSYKYTVYTNSFKYKYQFDKNCNNSGSNNSTSKPNNNNSGNTNNNTGNNNSGNTNNNTGNNNSGSTNNNTGNTNTGNNNSGSSSNSVLAIEKEVANLVNAERQKAGLKPLTLDSSISNVARTKSQDMADKKYFDHNSPTYGSPFDMMKKFGINYNAAGENIAMGQTTAKAVMNAWMNSPGHRANILSSKFGKIGVGYVIKNGTPYWTQMFTN